MEPQCTQWNMFSAAVVEFEFDLTADEAVV